MKPPSDLVNYFRLEAKILPNQTLHTSNKSYSAWAWKKKIVTTKWLRIKEIGVGNCGSVWLELDLKRRKRAVKRIPK